MLKIFSIISIVMVSEAYAQAYLDAGTGSMIIQLLLGGTAGIATLLRLYWHRIVIRFRPLKVAPSVSDTAQNADDLQLTSH